MTLKTVTCYRFTRRCSLPSLAEHQSNLFTKVLFLGDSKSGKTTALWSLVKVGYKLRILDFDNLLDSLKEKLLAECPHLLGNVEFRTLRDKYKMGPNGVVIDGAPKAAMSAMKMLNQWKYDEVDLGDPAEWGPECILVIDSLSRLCDAVYDHHVFLAGPKADGRAVYKNAQDAVGMILADLTSKTFQTNIIVICHGTYVDLPDHTTKIFPLGVGQKLGPKIPQYFPVYIRLKSVAGKRTLQLESDVMIDLAMPSKMKEKTLPADDGLATIFETLRGKPVPAATQAVARPK